MEKKTALIIGAGPAGLTAAYELLKRGGGSYRPIVLEASDAIGGISRTFEYKGNRMDIGGHRFFTKSPEVLALWHEILPLQGEPSRDDLALGREIPLQEGGPDPEKEDEAMLTRHRVSRILYLHRFFDYPISLKASTFRNMGFRRTMKAGFGYLGSMLHKRDENSLADFYVNRFGKPLYEMFFEDYTEKVWGRNPRDISPDWGAQRVKGLSLWKTVWNALAKPFRKKDGKVETSLIERFEYPKYGPGFLYEKMAGRVREMGGEVLLRHEVVGIEMEGEKIKALRVRTPEGEKRMEGDIFLSTMALKDLFLALPEGAAPVDVREAAVALPYRDFITVGLLLDHLKIRNETKERTVGNIVPDTWIYVQEREVRMGRIQICNNWSPYMVKEEGKVWIGLEYFANEGDGLWEMEDKDFIRMAIEELAKIGVIEGPEDVLDSVRLKVKKAYPAYFDSYKDIGKVEGWLQGVENLYCLGRNGQHRYNNMDHSMLTAIEAVSSILDPEGHPKEDVWKVNTEKEYHEEGRKKE